MSDGFPDIPPGGCVNWTAFDVPTIWAMLAYEDGTLSVEQANAWNRTYDLLASHAKNLQALRDGLAERWPPERSEASAVFLEYLDELIGAVNPTSYASSSNAVVLSDLIDTLAAAKGELAPLHQQWQAGTGDPKLQAELNARAAKIMASTDVAVYQHGQRFVVPPEYEPPAEAFYAASPITDGRADPSTTPTKAIGASSRQTTPSQLRGIGSHPQMGGDVSLAGGGAPAKTASPATSGAPRPPTFISTPSGRAMAPGGIIGTDPARASYYRATPVEGTRQGGGARGTTSAADSSEIDSSRSRASTRGGSYPATSSELSSDESRGAPGLVGGIGGRPRRREPIGDAGEAYFVWTSRKGVPAVLQAPEESNHHDPGPGVFGIDR
jgi:hypothetical protein